MGDIRVYFLIPALFWLQLIRLKFLSYVKFYELWSIMELKYFHYFFIENIFTIKITVALGGPMCCYVTFRIEALCECSPEDKKGEPRNVMYGWCVKCRAKFPEDYKKVEG